MYSEFRDMKLKNWYIYNISFEKNAFETWNLSFVFIFKVMYLFEVHIYEIGVDAKRGDVHLKSIVF